MNNEEVIKTAKTIKPKSMIIKGEYCVGKTQALRQIHYDYPNKSFFFSAPASTIKSIFNTISEYFTNQALKNKFPNPILVCIDKLDELTDSDLNLLNDALKKSEDLKGNSNSINYIFGANDSFDINKLSNCDLICNLNEFNFKELM